MKSNNVVPFERDIDFYLDLSYKYHQKGCLKTALRYMEKAVELDPSDSFLQFNYAGILAEIGDIEGSSNTLLNIVNNIDPDYDECYFGLGCNYLQLQKVRKAIKYFEKYAEISPDGDFIEETENLIEMLNMIKDSNNDLNDEELERVYEIEEEGIRHLEKREYKKALNCFQEVVDKLPNAIPAKNNLSLSYYYLGKYDKAIEIAEEVIMYEPENVHANCNLCIYFNKIWINNQLDILRRSGDMEYRNILKYDTSSFINEFSLNSVLERQIRIVRKINPNNEDYAYKIADTFGSLSKHKDAYKAYKRLLRYDNSNLQYMHFVAIAAYNCKKYYEALSIWEKLSKLELDNHVIDYYRKAAIETQKGGKHKFFPYSFQLPKEEISRRIKKTHHFLSLSGDDCRDFLKNDENIIDCLYYVIVFDKYLIRKLVFNKIKKEKLIELEPMIRDYLLRTGVDKSIKMESVFLLNSIGIKEPYYAYVDGEVKEIAIESDRIADAQWGAKWYAVKNLTISTMKDRYEESYNTIVEDIWSDFLFSAYPDVPVTGKIEIWAAALEYAYCKFTCNDITQLQIAEKYEVSRSSLSEKFRIINSYIGNKFWGAE